MPDNQENDQDKVKELTEMMSKYIDDNPLVVLPKKDNTPNKLDDSELMVVETSRTIAYSGKEWEQYGELVGHSRRD